MSGIALYILNLGYWINERSSVPLSSSFLKSYSLAFKYSMQANIRYKENAGKETWYIGATCTHIWVFGLSSAHHKPKAFSIESGDL